MLSPLRIIILIFLVCMGAGFGYGIAHLLQSPRPVVISEEPAVDLSQAPLTVIPKLEDAPVRAYEETLPSDIFEPENIDPIQANIKIEKPEKQIDVTPAVSTGALSPPSLPKSLPPWQQYAVPVDNSSELPRIAIVIDDLGVDKKRTQRTIDLPGPLTLSFLTYATHLKEQARAAQGAGHELLLHVPMEPSGEYIDPGPNVLLAGMPSAEIETNLEWALSRMTGFVGINNHMGSRFTSDQEGMDSVMKVLYKHNYLFVDSMTIASSKGSIAARKAGVPFLQRNIFLDHVEEFDQITARLADVERIASKRGSVIAIGHPRETTLQALIPWLATIEARGFKLVPVSNLIQLPE